MALRRHPHTMTEASSARIAITGTPGTGKTSICKLAESTVSVSDLAAEIGALGEVDPTDGAAPIDIEKLRDFLAEEWAQPPDQMLLVDGHLSHLLPVDAVVIIRCDPRILGERNAARNWAGSKVEENSEWELLGGAWSEQDEWENLPVLELESTENSPEVLFTEISDWIGVAFKPDSPEHPIDWVERIHG